MSVLENMEHGTSVTMRRCTRCRRPVKGHIGPCGDACQYETVQTSPSDMNEDIDIVFESATNIHGAIGDVSGATSDVSGATGGIGTHKDTKEN